MIKKQMMIISACAVVFAILIGVYFVAVQPMLEENNAQETFEVENVYGDDGEIINKIVKSVFKTSKGKTVQEEIIMTLLPGEELGQGNRIMIIPKVDKKDIKNVQVKNSEDNYKLIHHLGNDIYYVEGAELVPQLSENISSFFTNAGYLLSMLRVAAKDIDDGNEILADLEPFGLNPESDPNYFTVTTVDDEWYKIIIGSKIPTRGGYYVMYEDKDGLRPAIYILDTLMEDTILSTRYSLMTPLVAEPIKQNEIYFIDNFNYYRGAKELIVNIYQAPIPEDSDAIINRIMGYPLPYMISGNYDALSAIFTTFLGERVVYAWGMDEEISEEKLIEYGFGEPTAIISFDLYEREYYFAFSKQNEDGNYYVLTEFNSIVEVLPETLRIEGDRQTILEWDERKFIDKAIFSESINDVASIEIKIPGESGILFTIERPDETKRDLIVKGNGVDIGVDGMFRDLYYSILSIEWQDYQEETEIYEEKDPMLEMVIVMRDGFERQYKFYFVESNTRRSFFTLNGFGEFYVLRDKVLKLMNDTKSVLQNIAIDRDALE